MRAAILLFPGSNRDGDVARALRRSGAEVSMAWHADTDLPDRTDLAVNADSSDLAATDDHGNDNLRRGAGQDVALDPRVFGHDPLMFYREPAVKPARRKARAVRCKLVFQGHELAHLYAIDVCAVIAEVD